MSSIQTFHLIGIKGAGMSALAQVLHDMGHQVQGSDVETRYFTQESLEAKGIPLLPFQAENIKSGLRAIASNAFPDDHAEIAACRKKGNVFQRYHEFLAELIVNFTSVAVTGTHGKTTTTGWLAHVFRDIRPTSFLIGDGTGAGVPDSRIFIFESCEYRRHFLAYSPDYAVITNINFDHPDYYRDVADVETAFAEMAGKVKRHIVACGDDERVRGLRTNTPLLFYGFAEDNELRAMEMEADRSGTHFDVYYQGRWIDRFSIPLYGRHNVQNALAVIAISLLEDLPMERVKERLLSFPGVKRRFSEKKVRNNVVIDDYAHHPTEIRATIEAVRLKYPEKRLVSIFQPHTYSRLQKLLNDFSAALAASDDVYVCDIFGSARESEGEVNVLQLIERIPGSIYLKESTVDELRRYSEAVLLFMGAGDIQKYETALEASSPDFGAY